MRNTAGRARQGEVKSLPRDPGFRERVRVKVRERVRATYTKRKSVGPENFEQVITLEFAMVFGKLDNFEYLRDRIEKMF